MKKILLMVFCVSLCFACSEMVDEINDDNLKSGHLGSGKDGDTKMVTVPFKIDLVGTYQPFGDKCPANVIVEAEGNGTHVGNCTGYFDFCVDPTTFGTDSVLYGDAYSYLVAANGDSLFMTLSGAVVQTPLDDHPDYVTSYWRDPFIILGGTGRFKDASGGGMSDDYNHLDYPENSFHHWEGTITMIKGKGKK